MLPTIASGNVASAIGGAYEVANSCRFNDGDTAYMHKTCSSAFDTDKWTISIWFKKCTNGIAQRLISCDNDDGENDDYVRFTTDDTIQFLLYSSGSVIGRLDTNMRFRDCSAWYHLVCVWDSANGVAGNRMRMYVNGTEITSFAVDTNPTSGVNASWGNTSHPIEVGRRGTNGTQYFDGYIAEVAVCDGQAYAASDFGEFDSDSPTIWKPKDVSELTFGTSGFYLDFEDSANLGNDANGGTDLTEVNLAATDQSTDSPTNNFATLNPLQMILTNAGALSEGNLKLTANGSDWTTQISTIAVSSGKWYAECKAISLSDVDFGGFGIVSANQHSLAGLIGQGATIGVGYQSNGSRYENNNISSSYFATFTNGDILALALDLDNETLQFYKNGSTTGSEIDISSMIATSNYPIHIGCSGHSSSTLEMNYGNPPYANSSSVADADGYGAFEYAPPSGYFALCTKNLGAYGG